MAIKFKAKAARFRGGDMVQNKGLDARGCNRGLARGRGSDIRASSRCAFLVGTDAVYWPERDCVHGVLLSASDMTSRADTTQACVSAHASLYQAWRHALQMHRHTLLPHRLHTYSVLPDAQSPQMDGLSRAGWQQSSPDRQGSPASWQPPGVFPPQSNRRYGDLPAGTFHAGDAHAHQSAGLLPQTSALPAIVTQLPNAGQPSIRQPFLPPLTSHRQPSTAPQPSQAPSPVSLQHWAPAPAGVPGFGFPQQLRHSEQVRAGMQVHQARKVVLGCPADQQVTS